MKDTEFNEILTDFDGFMRKHGYYTVKEIAEHEGTTVGCIRQCILRGQIKNTVNINGKRYIPFEYCIERKYKKRRAENGNTKNT